MLALKESILKSNNSGIEEVIKKDPEKFAKYYLKAEHYFVSQGTLYVTFLPDNTKIITIDDNFPRIEFKIGSFGASDYRKIQIIIKDYKFLLEHFRAYGTCELGGSRTDIIIDDSSSDIYYDELNRYGITGRLIIKNARSISFSHLPNIPSIILYRKNIGQINMPIGEKTKLVEIR